MKLLSNKIIVLTGASGGIGKRIAIECSKNGAKLILISRHIDELRDLNNQLVNKNNICYRLDVGDYKAVKSFFCYVKEKYSSIDGMVNCAGEFGPIGLTHNVDPKEFNDAVNSNLMGTFNMCHYGIPLLLIKNNAKIVNFSGGGATSPFPNYSAYACSKIAIVKLTENLGKEYGKSGLDVNIIAPGFVKTKLVDQTLKAGQEAGEFLGKTKNMIKNGGVSPALSARLVLFLLSRFSDGITGKFISAQWDNWGDSDFQNELRSDTDFTNLRRIDNKYFARIV